MAKRRFQSPDQTKRPSKHGAAREPESDDGDDDDDANTESQQMLALASLLRKPKTEEKELQQFRARITANRERLKQHLDEGLRQAEEAQTHRRDEITIAVLNALKTSGQGDTPTFAGTRIADNAAYKPVMDVLSSSEALLEEYERLDKMIIDMRDKQVEPIAETWHQDVQKVEQKLRLGSRVARRNLKKVLGADVEEDIDGDGDGDEEMQDAGREQELNYELMRSIRYAERGVKRMVKGLPDGEVQ